MTDPTAPAAPAVARPGADRGRGWVARLALPLLAVALAVAVRVPHLGRAGYDLDEMWSAEVATGRGSPHASLATDRLIWPAPNLTRLAGAPPAWRVWSHMEATHPPLYEVVLRLWQDAGGTGDGRERALSVVASAVAVAVLYDAVRMRAGVGPAFWAACLMAVAGPQVEYGRLARSYALLTAAAVAMAAAVARIEVRGPTRRRGLTLAGATAATLLTHYFAVAPVAAVAVYAAVFTRGPARRAILTAVAAGAGGFAVVWLPFVPGQAHLFAANDVATEFLRHDLPHHAWLTLVRVALAPVSMVLAPSSASAPFAAAGAVLYAAPLLAWMGRRVDPGRIEQGRIEQGRIEQGRRTAGLAFWGLWLCASVGLPAALDLTRGTAHLFYVRYVLTAGPAVCALVPLGLAAGAAGRARPLAWVAHVVPAVAVLAAAVALPYDVYAPQRSDPHEVVAALVPPPLSADDLLVFAAPPREAQFAGAYYLMLDRYLGPVPCPIVVLTGPASPAVLARARASRHVWLLGGMTDPTPYLPTAHIVGHGRGFPGLGGLWPLRVP